MYIFLAFQTENHQTYGNEDHPNIYQNIYYLFSNKIFYLFFLIYPHDNCLQHLTVGLPISPAGQEHTALPLALRHKAPDPHAFGFLHGSAGLVVVVTTFNVLFYFFYFA